MAKVVINGVTYVSEKKHKATKATIQVSKVDLVKAYWKSRAFKLTNTADSTYKRKTDNVDVPIKILTFVKGDVVVNIAVSKSTFWVVK